MVEAAEAGSARPPAAAASRPHARARGLAQGPALFAGVFGRRGGTVAASYLPRTPGRAADVHDLYLSSAPWRAIQGRLRCARDLRCVFALVRVREHAATTSPLGLP
jgi:hypothetical protein